MNKLSYLLYVLAALSLIGCSTQPQHTKGKFIQSEVTANKDKYWGIHVRSVKRSYTPIHIYGDNRDE